MTAATSCFAVALGVFLGVPGQVFATLTQYASLTAVMFPARSPPSGG